MSVKKRHSGFVCAQRGKPLGALSRYGEMIRAGIWNAPSLEIELKRQILRGKLTLEGLGQVTDWALHPYPTYPVELSQ